MTVPAPSVFAKLLASIGGALFAAGIGFFVWLAHIANRVSVIEETHQVERAAQERVDQANKEALSRIEHEREANDARVRDDLRELRAKVFQ